MKIDPQKLRAARTRAGLKTAELARIIGVSRPYVSMMETGKKPYLDAAKLVILCDRLGCNPSDVVTPAASSATGPPDRPERLPAPSPPVQRLADGSIRYNFVWMWSEEQLKEILPAAEAAGDWDLVASIAAAMKRRSPAKRRRRHGPEENVR